VLAAEHYDVPADITVLSKALGGGIPVAAVLMRSVIAESLEVGMHGTTFGGGPVAAAAANVVLAQVCRPAFLAHVRRLGRILDVGLRRLVAASPQLAETRGMGLLRAVVLADQAPFEPTDLIEVARAYGLLLIPAGGRSVRFLPPLNVTRAEVVTALDRFGAALAHLEKESHP
jgi:acetylornithine/N-succinyldiaminopimelate aminotransferase